MTGRLLAAALFLCAGALAQTPSQHNDRTVYKWVDEHGVVHYGDAVPPQYADQEKTLLNGRGVTVGKIEGKKTPEQLAAEAAQKLAEDKARAGAQYARERDQHLLATYLSVEEIESLRDRRLEILDAQSQVTKQYLDQLKTREQQLTTQAERFRPYNAAAVQPLPEHLSEDLVHLEIDIHNQQRNLDTKQREMQAMKTQFDSDIARFKELKSDSEAGRPSTVHN